MSLPPGRGHIGAPAGILRSILGRAWFLKDPGCGGAILSAGLGTLGTDFKSILALILEDLTFAILPLISGPCTPVESYARQMNIRDIAKHLRLSQI